MTINKVLNETALTIALEGRLDTTTAPELETVLKEALPGVTSLVFDFEKLDYISSAGLRVLLYAKKSMGDRGPVILKNVGEIVMEVLEVTGFADMLTIE